MARQDCVYINMPHNKIIHGVLRSQSKKYARAIVTAIFPDAPG